jgi:hypothetical protein
MTYSVDIYNAKGKVVDTVSLDPRNFSDDNVNNDLIHEYYLLQQSNARLPTLTLKQELRYKDLEESFLSKKVLVMLDLVFVDLL